MVVASLDAFVKKCFSHMTMLEMFACPLIYSFPMFAVAICFVPKPELDFTFFWTFAMLLPINGLAAIVYMNAIKISPLSLTLPYLAFTPIFMIATGFVFLGELPNIWGLSGIVTTCVGSYVLNIDPENRGWLSPFRAVFNERGSWLMLIVAFVFSFTAVLGKKCILRSSPVFFTMWFFAIHNLIFALCLLAFRKIRVNVLGQVWAKGIVAGGLVFFHVLFHGIAISLVNAAYMISIKRLSVLFGVLYGGWLFKEKNMAIRFAGAGFMLIGAAFITLKGS